MRIPRFIRWLLVLVALVFGWLAGGHLQESRAERQWRQREPMHKSAPLNLPATAPATSPA